MPELKRMLLQYCLKYAEERIKNAEDAILSAHHAALDDTKSSAGDKYETTREMMQQEISRHQKQLEEAKKLKYILSAINPEQNLTTVRPGSLVTTNQGTFFISVSAGKITVGSNMFFAVSATSPIGLKLTGLTKGSDFKFNGKDFSIINIS